MTTALDYPVASPPEVEPIFFRTQIIQSMALHYMAAADLSESEARDCALATWDTEWLSDPQPRTLEMARDEVDADLSYWGEE